MDDAILDFENFDPAKIDRSEFSELTAAIPKDGNVDAAIAENLATRFLCGADRCSEILSMLTWWAAKSEDAKRSAYAKAVLSANAKTMAEKQARAETDADYIASCETFNRARAIKQWFQNKHDSFLSAHYLMKEISKRSVSHQRASGQADGTWGERDWGGK